MSTEVISTSARDDNDARTATRNRLVQLRPVIGLIGLLMLGIEYVQAQDDADLASNVEASAVQYIQLYVPHIFDTILIIGAMIALYILTRLAD